MTGHRRACSEVPLWAEMEKCANVWTYAIGNSLAKGPFCFQLSGRCDHDHRFNGFQQTWEKPGAALQTPL